jgi:hypothetical protein
MSMKKIPMTPSGIDPATFWFVAQCLDYCATACPTIFEKGAKNNGESQTSLINAVPYGVG